jgi:hypothetical protein
MMTTYERGILQGERNALLYLWEKKFGLPVPAVKQHVESLSSAEEVRQLLVDVARAESIEELHLPD